MPRGGHYQCRFTSSRCWTRGTWKLGHLANSRRPSAARMCQPHLQGGEVPKYRAVYNDMGFRRGMALGRDEMYLRDCRTGRGA